MSFNKGMAFLYCGLALYLTNSQASAAQATTLWDRPYAGSQAPPGDCPQRPSALEGRDRNRYAPHYTKREIDGKIAYVNENDNVYIGEFKDGAPNGVGVYTFASGTRVEGTFSNGLPSDVTVYWPGTGPKYNHVHCNVDWNGISRPDISPNSIGTATYPPTNSSGEFVDLSLPRLDVPSICQHQSKSYTRSDRPPVSMSECMTEQQSSYDQLKPIWDSIPDIIKLSCGNKSDGYPGITKCVNYAIEYEAKRKAADEERMKYKFKY